MTRSEIFSAFSFGLLITTMIVAIITALTIGVVHATDHYTPAHPSACWTETNYQQPNNTERICGNVILAPASARNFSDN